MASIKSKFSYNKVSPEGQSMRMMSLRNAGNQQNEINLSDLGFEVCDTEEEQLQQLKRLRDMPCPIAVKRMLRTRLMSQEVKMMSGFKGWKARQKMERKRCALAFKNFSYKIELWQGSFKEIEGHFGTGVLSYFVFLKWLFQLNCAIFCLVFLFIVVPQLAMSAGSSSTYTEPCLSSNSSIYQNLEYYGDIVPNCSDMYQDFINTTSGTVNGTYDVVSYIADFFQGTGFMENTVLFYGYYSSTDLNVNLGVISTYNLPLAYIVVTAIYLLISLIMMVRQSAQGFKESIISGEDKYYQYCNKAFGTWDYALSDGKNVTLKKKSILKEIIHDLHEQKDTERRQLRTTKQWCGLWTLRVIINLFVLGALGGSGFLIYYVTSITSQTINTNEEYQTWHVALQLLIEFSPSLSITFLNILVPMAFEKVVRGEDYTPGVEIQLTLIRTVFLRLASLGILFFTLYSEINCSSKDECNVGIVDICLPLRCWETGIGQQLYKLVIMDFLVNLGITIFVEFPRKIIVSKCDCKLSKIIGYQQFVIPKNVLNLVYSQTLCWLGAFFSPLIPAICVAKLFIFFYTKKISLLSNFVPNTRPFRASKSNSFFVMVLLLSYVLCCLVIVYVIAIATPSRGCGPFRPYKVMYESILATICEWPTQFQQFLTYTTSFASSILIVIALSLTIYYQNIVVQGQKVRVKLLKDQLLMEGKDKQFLLAKLNDVQGGNKKSTDNKQRQSQKQITGGDGRNHSKVSTKDIHTGVV